MFYHANLFSQVEKNTLYRNVLYTVPGQLQVVIMSIPPKISIGVETHDGTQSITIHQGLGKGIVDGKEIMLEKGDILVIPPGSRHNVINRSTVQPLQLVSYYTPPEHPDGLKQKRKPKH